MLPGCGDVPRWLRGGSGVEGRSCAGLPRRASDRPIAMSFTGERRQVKSKPGAACFSFFSGIGRRFFFFFSISPTSFSRSSRHPIPFLSLRAEPRDPRCARSKRWVVCCRTERRRREEREESVAIAFDNALFFFPLPRPRPKTSRSSLCFSLTALAQLTPLSLSLLPISSSTHSSSSRGYGPSPRTMR